MVPLLLGPPEVRRADAQPPPELHDAAGSQPPPQPQPTTASSDPFMSLMSSKFNMTYTENESPTYVSTGNPCLDFFFHVVPDTPAPRTKELLQSAWAHDSLTTLKLVCNPRGVRGIGKSNKEGFYTAALWLHENHPKTLASNVDSFAEFGYFCEGKPTTSEFLQPSTTNSAYRSSSACIHMLLSDDQHHMIIILSMNSYS